MNREATNDSSWGTRPDAPGTTFGSYHAPASSSRSPHRFSDKLYLDHELLKNLVRDGWRTRRHQLCKPGILPQSGKLFVFVDTVNTLVPFFHRPPQVLQRSLRDAHLGVQLSNHVIVV